MTTRSRIRRHIDIGRLRAAIAGPGADPRNWCSFARVDVDPDAVVWDDVLGWLVDVTFAGGELEGDGPCPCRLAWGYLAAGEARSDPPTQGAQCIVVIPEGDPNVMPVIVGFLSDQDKAAPTSVNGTDVDEAYALATHFFVTGKNVSWQVAGTIAFAARSLALVDPNATQAYVRGNDQQQALDALLQAEEAFASAVAGALAGLGAPIPAPLAQFLAAIEQARSALVQALSTRINGE